MSTSLLTSEFSIESKLKTNRQGTVRWIASHASHYWFLFLIMILGAISNAALAAFVPDLIGQAFNAILASPSQISTLIRIAWIIIGSQLIRGVLQFARNFGAELIGQRVERDIRHELYVSLLGKSMTFHSLQPVGDTMARATNDVREVNFLFSPGLNLVIGSAVFIIMPIVVSPRYHPALVITPIIFTITYFIALWLYLRELQPITSRVRSAFGEMNTRLAEAIDGIETVKGMAQEKTEVSLFANHARGFRDAFVKQGDVEARFLPLLLLGLAEAGGLFHSLLLFRQGLLNVGEVVAYFGLIQLFGFPTFISLFAYSQISLGMAGATRLLELINRETDLDQNVQGFSGEMKGEIEFRNVSFSYNEKDDTLSQISFKVKPGQTIAIVGQTGSGKTTLAKLVNRTYDVRAGQVLVDGVDVRDWNLENLRKNVSIIEQDIFLFSRSVRNNISFGAPDSSDEMVRKAAQAAQAEEFIYSFQDGYDTVIGERGVTLSGGQRQRLALGRAFLTDPKILVLDDSTSAIDSATEDKIQRAIYAAAKGRTTLIITHRLSQIRWADLIVVLKKGEMVAVGSHEELMKTSDAYRRIFSE
ncbi:MAG TPA: ABC transporter ATP-binding protein [Anaerolineales bacterium]|nr:ABC transporter ATP-binding protein [Anaerolineales bacterium]